MVFQLKPSKPFLNVTSKPETIHDNLQHGSYTSSFKWSEFFQPVGCFRLPGGDPTHWLLEDQDLLTSRRKTPRVHGRRVHDFPPARPVGRLDVEGVGGDWKPPNKKHKKTRGGKLFFKV